MAALQVYGSALSPARNNPLLHELMLAPTLSELVQRPNSLDDFAAFYAIVAKTNRSRETYDRENMMIQASLLGVDLWTCVGGLPCRR